MSEYVRQRLEEIAQRRGILTPLVVLDEARNPEHPLHGRFEWDDTVAAEKYRLEQAHQLIRVARVSYVDNAGDSQSVRAYQPVARPGGYEYKRSEDIAADPLLTEIVLRDMRREWQTLKRRYERFEEFVAMVRGDVLV